MRSGITLTGRVIGPKGKPVEDATINWSAGTPANSSRVAAGTSVNGAGLASGGTKTDRQGRYRIPGLTLDEVSLIVRATGCAPEIKKITVEENMRPVDIRLKAGKTLRGRVVDAAGNGVPLAEIFLQSWQGATYWWDAKTDAQGRFTWTDAPEDEVVLSVSAEGYAYQRDWHVMAGPEEQVLTLKGQMQVTGRVIDANTGAPIPSFTVTPGIIPGQGTSIYWMRYASTAGKDGTFRLRVEQPGSRFQVRVEAAGYKPAVSMAFTEEQSGQALEFALEAGQGPGGIVLGIDGQPVSDAQVMLGTPSQPAMVVDGHAQPQSGSVTNTGPDGRFRLSPQTDPFLLVVLHDTGFAKVAEQQLKDDKPIRLQPWGRVEGDLRTGTKSGANEMIQLSYAMDARPDSPQLYFQYQSTTDEQGYFTFERVAPGDACVMRTVPMGGGMTGSSGTTPVEVKAGQTACVTIGGTGRPVIGKPTTPSDLAQEPDWSNSSCHILLQRQGPPIPFDVKLRGGQAVQAWYRDWTSSDAGRAWQRENRQFMFRPEQDGSFRVEDVPAGKYMLSVQLFKPADDGQRRSVGQPLANLSVRVLGPGYFRRAER